MLLLLLLLPLSLLAKELTLCYKAYYLFFPVAQTCITYRLQGEDLRVYSYAKTINVGGLVKRVYNYGYAVISVKNLMPKEFFYHQEEGEFKREQHYIFKNSKIYVKETHYVKLTDKVKKEEERVYPFDGHPDPYTASLVLYRNSIQNGAGVIKMFYDGKKYHIPYKVVGEEGIEVPAGNYYAKVVDVSPNVETKGLLQPKGSWKLWIEKTNLFPVRMQLFFVLGSVRALLEEVKGDRDLLRNVLLGQR
ncbi:MAG: DUF3108 domain-containing protein [Thermocrinis sp.]|nr:DUF3108 domain-containing protein [Thermocrinis sp.]